MTSASHVTCKFGLRLGVGLRNLRARTVILWLILGLHLLSLFWLVLELTKVLFSFLGEVCDIGTKTDKTTPLIPNCCHFPFWHKGKEYHSCTLDGAPLGAGVYWCSLTPTNNIDFLHVFKGRCGKHLPYYMKFSRQFNFANFARFLFSKSRN